MINIYKVQDNNFYAKMGKFFANRSISKELDGQLYNDEKATWGIFEEADEIKGFVSLQHGDKFDVLDNFYVLPEYRNKGLGTQLLNEILGYADKDIKLVTRNEIAFSMYMMKGFDIVRKNGRFYTMIKKVQ